ncbi:MAG: phage tail tape measure protein [Anaerorhabdus sp.]|uniref:phage tail tape measure protein n=1 Tax=Anaerorhabdus sp. TaxID=1872524 RepID=UPI003A89F0DB
MAKDKLAGITLEIGGDTTQLSKALKQPNTEAKNLQDKLKAVDQALKLDPKNVDLLAQKQRLLADTVDTTEKKLSLLKDAQKKFVESGKDVDSAEYIELQKQIKITEDKIKNLSKEQSTFNGNVQAMGISLTEIGTKSVNAGKKMSVVSAGVAAIGTASVIAFNEVDNAMDTIVKGTGATGDELDALNQSFKNVYSTMAVDADDVGKSIADLNTRFGFTGDVLEEASSQFLKFAEVNGVDVSSAVALVSRAMGDASIDSSEYGQVLDSLTAASQASGISIDKLTENITKYGAPMRALGYDTNESIAIFASWEKAGVNTEIAFSGMKKAISNYTKEGKDAKVEFSKLIEGVQNGSVSAQEALEIFGAKAGPDLVDAIQQGRFSFEDMLTVVESSGGKLSQTYEDTLDPIDKNKIAMNNLKIAGTELATAIQTVLAPIIDAIVEKVRAFTTWFSGLDANTKEMIVKIGLLVAAIGPALIVFGKIAQAIGSLIGLSKQMGVVFGFLKTVVLGVFNAILAHPIIAGIAAIIAVIVLLYNNCEWFRDGVNAIVQSIWNFITTAFTAVKDFLFKTIPETINKIIEWFKELPSKLSKIVDDAIAFVKNIPNALVDIGKNIVTGLWKGITSMGSWLGNNLKSWADGVVKNIAGFFGIHSPSTVMAKIIGKQLPAGVGVGVKDNEDLAINPLLAMANKMKNIASTGFVNQFSSAVKGTLTSAQNIVLENVVYTMLDGKIVAKNTTSRITKTQNNSLKFKGAY